MANAESSELTPEQELELEEEKGEEAEAEEEDEDEDEELELEQSLSREEFNSLLGHVVDALGNGKDLEFDLDGCHVRVPSSALHIAEFEAEYEEDDDECELELKIEWKKLKA